MKTTKQEEQQFLSKYQQWEIIESEEEGTEVRELHRVYKFKTFELAFGFMSDAAEQIITKQDHHPRWENSYNRVEVWLTTTSLNRQLSSKDIQQAIALEELWSSSGQG